MEVWLPAGTGNPILRVSPDVVVQDLQGETLVYNRERSRLYVLNSSAAAIFRLCDGRRAEAEIARELGESYREVGESKIQGDVHHTLNELIELEIVTRD